MRAKKFLLQIGMCFLPILTLANTAQACSCLWEGPFFKVAPKADLVVRAIVKDRQYSAEGKPTAMDVAVRGTLRGITPGMVLHLIGDTGALCRPNFAEFPIGSEWVLALTRPEQPQSPEEKLALSICGSYWLRIQRSAAGEEVEGNLSNPSERLASERMDYQKFVFKFSQALAEN